MTADRNAYRRARRARLKAEGSPLYERELAAARALKERYRGSCEVCGKPTTGCDGPGSSRRLCIAHFNAALSFGRRGSGPTIGRALELLSERPMRFMELADALGVTNSYVSNLTNRMLRYGFVERPSRGLYRLTPKGRATCA